MRFPDESVSETQERISIIERSLTDQPQYPLANHDVLSETDATVLLYGSDSRTGVVAIEPAGPYEVEVFFADGWKRRWSERHVGRPWAVLRTSGRVEGQSDVDITPLRGNHPYRELVSFQTWAGWRQAGMSEAIRNGEAIGPGSFAAQYQFRTGTTLFKGMTYGQIRRLQLDIETTTLDPDDPDAGIIMIALKLGTYEDVLVSISTEEALLADLNTVIQKYDPDVIEGHNIYAFDIPYIISRANSLRVDLRWGRNKSAPAMGMEGRQQSAYVHGRQVIDTLVQVQKFDIAGNLTRYGLKDVIRQLGLEREDREFVAGDAIRAAWESGDHERLARYALDDVRDVDALSKLIMPNEFYQTQMVPMSYQQCATRGTGRKIDDLMIRGYLSALHSMPAPMRSEPFPGGFVEVVHTGVFGPVVKCDVESLYPSIMLREHIHSRNDTLAAYPVMLKDLRERRVAAKHRAQDTKTPDRAMWDGLQGGFKILINSFFGYLGFARGHFNDYAAATQITLEGQRLIQMIVAQLEQAGATPIEVDTDGVYFVPPPSIAGREEEIRFVESIGNALPEGITLAHDGSFAAMLSLKQKTYALLGHDSTLKLTGASLRSRALEPCFRDFIAKAALGFMNNDLPAVREQYFSLAEAVRTQSLPVEAISQTQRPRAGTLNSRVKLKRLLDQYPDRWRFGERIFLYEHESGEFRFAEDYAHDANTIVLLDRLKDVADRFKGALANDAVFEAAFPRITPQTDLALARERKPVQQLGLF